MDAEQKQSLYHPVTIGSLTIEGNLFLAPLAGYTDRAFRSVCLERGASFTYTEMVSAEGLARGSENTEKLMARAEGEDLLGVQIFMNEASVAIRALPRLLQHAPSIIDINCGCPVPKVVKTGSGSALMREPRKVQEMVRALKEYTDIPVSIKIRTGWDKDSVTFKEVADAALNAGVDMITMHARTRQEGYSGTAHWSALTELSHFVHNRTPRVAVFGSGDLFSPLAAKEMLKTTSVDGVMFARGAIGNPFIFEDTRQVLTGGKAAEHDLAVRMEVMLNQLHRMGKDSSQALACREMRKHATSYLKGIPHGSRAKQELVQATSYAEYERVCTRLVEGDL